MTHSTGISGSGTLPAALEKTVFQSSSPVAEAAKQTAPATQDSTRLSGSSSVLAQALNGSDVRSQKVASLQAAIANGSYNVPSSAVADKLIETLQRR